MKSLIQILFLAMITIATESYPKVGNYFLDPSIKLSEIDSLAKCDFLILDHEVARQKPIIIDSIRKINPDVKIIAYIVSQEMELDAATWKGSLRSSMIQEIQDSWWLKNSKGEYVTFWPGTRMLNIAAGQPEISSIKWNRYLASIVTDSILTNPRWDGIYLDNCWSTVSWQDSLIDYNLDGTPESAREIDSLWKSGMSVMLSLIRESNPSKIIMGNGAYAYGSRVNGALFEDFPTWGGWWRLYDTYKEMNAEAVSPTYNLINSTTANSGTIEYQKMRFGLVNAIMQDGYYSYDYGANDHSQHWWFDEYNVNLGKPIEIAQVKGETVITQQNFESGIGAWEMGDWKMVSSIVKDAKMDGSYYKAVISGEEEWNELLRSPEISIGEGALLKLSLHCKAIAAQKGATLFATLRKGTDYNSDISLGMIPLQDGFDSSIVFYTDSAFSGSGYSLLLGIQHGGTIELDSIQLESNETLCITRKFEHGMAILNPSPKAQQLSYPTYSRIMGIQAPEHNNGKDANSFVLNPNDGIVLMNRGLKTEERDVQKQHLSLVQNGKMIRINGVGDAIVRCNVFDFKGRVIFTSEVARGASSIDLKAIASGIYTVQLESRQGVQRNVIKL